MSAAFPLKALLYPTDWIPFPIPFLLQQWITLPRHSFCAALRSQFSVWELFCYHVTSQVRYFLLTFFVHHHVLQNCISFFCSEAYLIFIWVFIFSSLSFIKWLYFNYLFLNVVMFFPAGSWLQFFLSSMWSLCWNNFYLIYFIYIIYIFYSFSLPLKYLPNNIYIFMELEDYLVMGSKMDGILGNVTFSCLLTYYQKLRLITL